MKSVFIYFQKFGAMESGVYYRNLTSGVGANAYIGPNK